MELGILSADAITLEQVLSSAAADARRMGDAERDEALEDSDEVPPPYESQPRHRATGGARPATAGASAPAPPRARNPRRVPISDTKDYRELIKGFPDNDFWIQKHGESNKDHHRRTARFMYQAEFCTSRRISYGSVY